MSQTLRASNKKRGPTAPAPILKIDIALVEQLALLHCTNEEIAAGCKVSVDTFERRLKDKAFRDVVDRSRANGRMSLRRLQWDRAEAGSDTMCIWLGKQLLGQRDRTPDEAAPPPTPVRVVIEFVGDAPPTIEGKAEAPEAPRPGRMNIDWRGT